MSSSSSASSTSVSIGGSISQKFQPLFKVTPSPVVKKGYSAALWWVPKGLLCQNLDFWHVKHGEKVLCLGGKSVSLRWRLAKTHVATFRGRTATNLAF